MGLTRYHACRMLAALELIQAGIHDEVAARLATYHARLAARAALNGLYKGRRPTP